jgi:hypothetical protein
MLEDAWMDGWMHLWIYRAEESIVPALKELII